MNVLEIDPAFEALLEYLKQSRGFDFTGYKRSSLMRRVRKRMQTIEVEAYDDYLDYLEVHPDEFAQLFDTLLINVTSFFRDRSAWDYIAEAIIPQIVSRKQNTDAIRVWTAGCASGEETYTVAILLAEALGLERFRECVKIYATDVDEEALSQARSASYESRRVSNVPEELLDKYFEPIENRYCFRKDLRRSVIFGRHDLVQDAPIPRIDLLTCRNTLMYFNAETQGKILAHFHFALVNSGFLFLGKAETLLSQNSRFVAIDLKQRIFGRTQRTDLRDRSIFLTPMTGTLMSSSVANYVRTREAAFNTAPIAQIIIDPKGILLLANDQARSLFNLAQQDLGRPLQDLELSYRPVELRSSIGRAYTEGRTITLRNIEWIDLRNSILSLEVQISLLADVNGGSLGVSITFTDMSRQKQLQQALEHSNQELEMAYEELQASNEELETTNEELHSTVEELETTNEELQSTNEELETMNEELQSTNEELQSMNEMLSDQSGEVNRLNGFLESILTSLRSGVAVLDHSLHIQVWNPKAEDLWGLRADEVQQQHFFNLDIGLPVEQLRSLLRNCLAGEPQWAEMVLDATNRRGRAIQCKVSCAALLNLSHEIQGVILLMEQVDREA